MERNLRWQPTVKRASEELARQETRRIRVVPGARSNADASVTTDAVQEAARWVLPLRQEMRRVIVGQDALIDRLLVALVADGHVLLEGMPGLAKTLALRTLSGSIQSRFQRIQFTPDMLPADIVGTEIFNPRDGTFEVKRGPVFTNLLLADEINRAPAKVQSALLEAMQERQVTIGDETHPLPDLFLVMATQNPIEQEGTYRLPEAQVDRFMLKVTVRHPSITEERRILDVAEGDALRIEPTPVVSTDEILHARKVVRSVHMDERVKGYIVELVYATREPGRWDLDLTPYIEAGASPRATINLAIASKAVAFLDGRGYATPQDVKTVAMDVLRHRVATTYEAEAEGLESEHLVQQVLDAIPVP